MEINIKEARTKFSALINQVADGEEIILTRRGKEVARLIPSPSQKIKKLPSLEKFRRSIKLSGKPLSETVIDGRNEERY